MYYAYIKRGKSEYALKLSNNNNEKQTLLLILLISSSEEKKKKRKKKDQLKTNQGSTNKPEVTDKRQQIRVLNKNEKYKYR